MSQAFSCPLSQEGTLALVFSDFCAAGADAEVTSHPPPPRPPFTEGSMQDRCFPDIVTASPRASHFSINSIHFLAAINLFEKETLPFPVNWLYGTKMLDRKSIYFSFSNSSKRLEAE